MTLFNK